MEQRLRPRRVPAPAQRQGEGPQTCPSPGATTGRGAAAAPPRDLQWPAVPYSGPGSRSHLEPWMGAHQDQPGVVREAGYALTATHRTTSSTATNAPYVQGCVRSECRGHQRVKMAGNEPRLVLIRKWSRETPPPVINGKSSQPMSSATAAIDGDNSSRPIELQTLTAPDRAQ